MILNIWWKSKSVIQNWKLISNAGNQNWKWIESESEIENQPKIDNENENNEPNQK